VNAYTRMTGAREMLAVVLVGLFILPFYFLVSMALKPAGEVLTTSPLAPPAQPSVESFATVLGATGRDSILLGMVNSVIITGLAVLAVLAVGSITAYVFARRFDRLSNVTYYLVLAAMVLPSHLALVPLYIGARSVGLLGTHLGMILYYLASFLPLAVFLFGTFFRAMPREYEEAATVDGANRWQIFRRIVVPQVAPVTITVAIMIGMLVWNDFFTPLIFLSGSGAITVPVLMYNYVGTLVSQWNNIFALIIVSMLPVLILYILFQRRFMQGFAGGLKH